MGLRKRVEKVGTNGSIFSREVVVGGTYGFISLLALWLLVLLSFCTAIADFPLNFDIDIGG